MIQKLAQGSNPFGTINPPAGVDRFAGGDVAGVPILVTIGIRTLIVLAAVYAVFNLILAGYWYISGASDPKRLHDATGKIWQTVVGLAIAAGSIAIAGVISQLVFGDPDRILNIEIFTPQ